MMNLSEQSKKLNFLYPRSRYYGQFKPKYLVFNANLQKFAQKIAYISALQTGGKITTEQAYQDIKRLWKQLKQSRKAMDMDGENL